MRGDTTVVESLLREVRNHNDCWGRAFVFDFGGAKHSFDWGTASGAIPISDDGFRFERPYVWVYKDLKVTFVNGRVSDVQ